MNTIATAVPAGPEPNDLIQILLTVARVGSGGNTYAGLYHYSFQPPIAHVGVADTQIVYALSKATAPEITLRDMYVNCLPDELLYPTVSTDQRSISVLHRNSRQQLAMLSLTVYDSQYDALINCDPQITNTPETAAS